MKSRINIQILFLLCLLIPLVFLVSCKDDDEVDSGLVELYSYGPSGVKHGETIKFLGKNLNKVTAIVLAGAEVNSNDFTTHTAELIELIVPQQAAQGRVKLISPEGEIQSKSILSFEVPVTITSITAEAKPGTNISIKGTFINWVEEVIFNEDIVVTTDEFVSQTMSELVVTVPMAAKSGLLVINTGGTEPLSIESEEDLIVTLPNVTGLTPTSLKHSAELTISGTDLDLVTTINVPGGTTLTDFVSQSENQIVIIMPNNAVKGMLTLGVQSLETVQSPEFSIILPAGTNISPKPASPGVDDITITGTNLDLVKGLKLPGITNLILASNFISHTPTQIVLALPTEAEAGGISYTTIHDYSNNLGVSIALPGAPPPPLTITMFDETIGHGGGNWSWGGVSTLNSTEQAYTGTVSWKFASTGWGGLSAGGLTPIDASGLNYLSFALFGGPGTDNAKVAVILNDNWSDYKDVTLSEGKWTEYQIPLSSYTIIDKSAINRFTFKVEGMETSIIYADRVGFE